MAIVEVTKAGRTPGESFEGHRKTQRIRLLASESRWITYVLCTWETEVGAGSNFGAMAQAIAQNALPDEIKRKPHVQGQTIACGGIEGPGSFDANAMSAIERWCDKKRNERDAILRSWRALCLMGRSHNPSLPVLVALYGDRPPGMPPEGRWAKDVDTEYRRVVKYASGGGGGSSALAALLFVDTHRRADETPEGCKARLAGAEAARRHLLADLAGACERLIVRAANEYRMAWRDAV